MENLALIILNYDISIRIMKHNNASVNGKKIEAGRMAKDRLDEIRFKLKTGQISYDEAKEAALEPLEDLYAGMVEVSKKYGFGKPRKPNFAGMMR